MRCHANIIFTTQTAMNKIKSAQVALITYAFTLIIMQAASKALEHGTHRPLFELIHYIKAEIQSSLTLKGNKTNIKTIVAFITILLHLFCILIKLF